MFSRSLSSIPFVEGAAGNALQNISGVPYNSDQSFLATLRALLLNRIGEDENFHCDIETKNMATEGYVERTLKDELLEYIAPAGVGQNHIIVIGLSGLETERKKVLAFLDAAFIELRPSFRKLEDVQKFSEMNHIDARFFIDEETARAYLIVDELDTRKLHFIQSMTPRYIPKLFKDKPITALEQKVLVSLAGRDPNAYRMALSEVFAASDLRARINRQVIIEFEQKSRRDRVRGVERELTDIRNRIGENISLYRDLIRRLENANIRYEGLKAILNGADAGDDSGLAEFIANNKMIELVDAEEGVLSFIVSSYLDSVDPEMYASYAANAHSSLRNDGNSYNGVFAQWENRKKVLDALFSEEPTMRLKVCAHYSVSLSGDVSAGYYEYPVSYSNHMRNPHLEHHGCLGDHRRFICEKLCEGDVVGAILQCIASARSMNIGESATTRYFLSDLFKDVYGDCIELPDGTCVSATKALEYLNKEAESK